ncbi:MAG: histidine phosphatase family protein [Bacteroidota bacterium]
MKTVLFLRHGKSDWEADYSGDHERPLAKRGVKAAKRMGRLIEAIGAVPDRALTSTAVRARTTLELAMSAGGWICPVEQLGRLYHASPGILISQMRAEPDETETLLLVGHEPGWSETIEALIGGGTVRFPTAAFARVDLHIDRWQDTDADTGELKYLMIPKAIG